MSTSIITKHHFLDKYPINPESKKLILGTIHPHDTEKFQIDFFYGHRNSLWNILSDAFPGELPKPIDLEKAERFLSKRRIAVSDTISVCERKSTNALDTDLVPLELNSRLFQDIKNSEIEHILFTSGFGKNNAFKLFYVDILKYKYISGDIKLNRETTLDSSVFGRPVKLTVLYSPSGRANTGIARSRLFLKEAHKYQDLERKVHAFKVDLYKNAVKF